MGMERRDDIDFNELVGLAANVNIRSLTSTSWLFLICSSVLQVWNLLVRQTNLYANQKKGAAEKSAWYPVTVDEMKGWVAIYFCMGIVNKPNLPSYWSTDPIMSTPFFG